MFFYGYFWKKQQIEKEKNDMKTSCLVFFYYTFTILFLTILKKTSFSRNDLKKNY